jgi:hypothetical protein
MRQNTKINPLREKSIIHKRQQSLQDNIPHETYVHSQIYEVNFIAYILLYFDQFRDGVWLQHKKRLC